MQVANKENGTMGAIILDTFRQCLRKLKHDTATHMRIPMRFVYGIVRSPPMVIAVQQPRKTDATKEGFPFSISGGRRVYGPGVSVWFEEELKAIPSRTTVLQNP